MKTTMKTLIHCTALVAAALMAGCATQPKPKAAAQPKPVHEQGWIGGNYKCAKPRATLANWLFGGKHIIYCYPAELEHTQKAGIFISALATNAPAYRAGLRPGDLILELDHQPVTGLRGFWTDVHAARPGAPLTVRAWRAGQTTNYDLIVGREKYWNVGTVALGLPGFWGPFHPVPTGEMPTFSLMALGWQRDDNPTFNFDSVEQRYRHDCFPKAKQEGANEDWRCWLAIMEVTRSKNIVGQEP